MWKELLDAKKKGEDQNDGCIIKYKHAKDYDKCKVRSLPLQVLENLNEEFNTLSNAVQSRAFLHLNALASVICTAGPH